MGEGRSVRRNCGILVLSVYGLCFELAAVLFEWEASSGGVNFVLSIVVFTTFSDGLLPVFDGKPFFVYCSHWRVCW